MGNYNHTHGSEKPIKGVVSAAIQEISQQTNFELVASGLTAGGKILYQRLKDSHSDSIEVTEVGANCFIKSVANGSNT